MYLRAERTLGDTGSLTYFVFLANLAFQVASGRGERGAKNDNFDHFRDQLQLTHFKVVDGSQQLLKFPSYE